MRTRNLALGLVTAFTIALFGASVALPSSATADVPLTATANDVVLPALTACQGLTVNLSGPIPQHGYSVTLINSKGQMAAQNQVGEIVNAPPVTSATSTFVLCGGNGGGDPVSSGRWTIRVTELYVNPMTAPDIGGFQYTVPTIGLARHKRVRIGQLSVNGQALPGVQLRLQALLRNEWTSVASIRTDRNGLVGIYCSKPKKCHHDYRFSYTNEFDEEWVVSPAFHLVKAKKKHEKHAHHRVTSASLDAALVDVVTSQPKMAGSRSS